LELTYIIITTMKIFIYFRISNYKQIYLFIKQKKKKKKKKKKTNIYNK